MATIKTKTISFTEEYIEEYKHVIKQSNASRYVCELVRADMSNNDSDNFLKQSIKTLVEEILKEKQTEK